MKTSYKLFLLVSLIAISLVSIILKPNNPPADVVASAPRPKVNPPIIKQDIISAYLNKKADNLSLITLSKWSWRKGGFGSVMLGTFTVSNKTGVPIKDLLLSCGVYGNSGTRIGAINKVMYETVQSGGKKVVKDLNLGLIDSQAASARCEIANFEYALEAIAR